MNETNEQAVTVEIDNRERHFAVYFDFQSKEHTLTCFDKRGIFYRKGGFTTRKEAKVKALEILR